MATAISAIWVPPSARLVGVDQHRHNRDQDKIVLRPSSAVICVLKSWKLVFEGERPGFCNIAETQVLSPKMATQLISPKAEGTKLQSAKSLEGSKLLYILVQDGPPPGAKDGEKGQSHRYTRGLLQNTLTLMGCKPRHAIKISDKVFEVVKSEMPPKKPKRDKFMGLAPLAEIPKFPKEPKVRDSYGLIVNPKPLKKRSTATVTREKFLDVVCDGLRQYHYLGAKQRADLMVACRIRERRSSITVLLCGTSGCGKSTLASMLGQRLGVTTVVSTDSVRHMMRGFVSEKENPLLWASTYHAGEFLDPQAVAEDLRAKKAAKHSIYSSKTTSTGTSTPIDSSISTDTTSQPATSSSSSNAKGKCVDEDQSPIVTAEGHAVQLQTADSMVSPKVMAVEGFKAQSKMVMDSVDRLITSWETKKESVVVEGVHLSINFVINLMKKHPSIVPFMVYIANESKHMQRFAVRAKYMTLDPAKNKYVKYIRNIRTIQDYLCKGADKHLVPKINNTNVDKSVAAIHATVFNCLRRREAGEPLFDAKMRTSRVVHQEYTKQYTSSALGSKSMFQLIQRKGSSRNLMAVVNADGSVAKAWPLQSLQIEKTPAASIFEDRAVGTPIVGPFSVHSSEPVHLQFGSLGLSSWPEKSENSSATAQTPNVVENGLETGNASSDSSGLEPTKELEEDLGASGSDEDFDDEEAGEKGEHMEAELEPVEEVDEDGSVDDGSVRSEGEDEFIEGEEDDAYWEYDDNSPTPRPLSTGTDKVSTMSRLRSFDRAAAGRGAPELRKTVSYRRASSRRRTPPIIPTTPNPTT